MLLNQSKKNIIIKTMVIIGFLLICSMLFISHLLVAAAIIGISLSAIAKYGFEGLEFFENELLNKVSGGLILMIAPAIIIYIVLNNVFVEPFLPKNSVHISDRYINAIKSSNTLANEEDEQLVNSMISLSVKISEATGCSKNKEICGISNDSYSLVKQDIQAWIKISEKMEARLESASYQGNSSFIFIQNEPSIEFQKNLASMSIVLILLYLLLLILGYDPKSNKMNAITEN